MKPEITLIIPLYNAELFIVKTLESIANQSFENFSVIIVNDGSTDDSEKVVSDFICNDSRFFLYKKNNHGVSSARNFGLNIASSEYVSFIDSDDYLEKNYLEDMLSIAREDGHDVVICNYKIISNKKELEINTFLSGQGDEYISNILSKGMWGVVWNKVFKREFLMKENISFLEGVNFWEDLLFNMNVLSRSPSISHTKSYLYNYVVREGSLLHSENNKSKVMDKIKVVNEVSKVEYISKNFKRELDAIKIHAKNEFITEKRMYNPKFWRETFPMNFPSLIKSDMATKKKIYPFLAKMHLHWVARCLLFIRSVR